RMVVGTKSDVATMEWDGERVSAVTGAGVPELVGRLAVLVDEARAAEPGPEAYVVHRPQPEGIRVERDEDGALVVRGQAAERAVAVNDLTNLQALDYVRDRLKRLGVDKALARAGAREGDVVRIGRMTLEYSDESAVRSASPTKGERRR
ncbi:MAG: GTPase, partial [Actinomycetota bacterium]|nr:GTPase [Actinomycetota bacterium]